MRAIGLVLMGLFNTPDFDSLDMSISGHLVPIP
jgi:hypothetical protein